MFAVYNKIVADKQAMLFRDFGHEALPGFRDKTFGFMSGL